MATAVKILKTILILALIAAVILVFWFGIMSGKAAVDIPIPEPAGLGLYPTDLVAVDGWEPNFSLIDFIDEKRDDGVQWGSKTEFFDGDFEADPANPGREKYVDTGYKVADAINLIRLADYNERNLPFFGYFTDAGGSADIAGAIKGNLMSQTIHAQNGNNYFHQNINAIVQDPDFQMNASVVTMAESILNKAKRQIDYGDYFYVLQGAFPQYLVGEELVNEDGEVVLVDGKPTTFDDGRCTANWTAAMEKGLKENKDRPTGLSADEEFALDYGNKYILSLNPQDYVNATNYTPTTWFKPEGCEIEKIYVDENGEPAKEETDHWYIRVVAEASLPPRPESGDLTSWINECGKHPLNNTLSISNPNHDGKIKDFTNEKINNLQQYTGANEGVCFTALKYTYEIWDCGVMRSWRTDEGWYGTLVMFTGDVQPFNPTTYTYDKDYCQIENFFDYLKIDPATV